MFGDLADIFHVQSGISQLLGGASRSNKFITGALQYLGECDDACLIGHTEESCMRVRKVSVSNCRYRLVCLETFWESFQLKLLLLKVNF